MNKIKAEYLEIRLATDFLLIVLLLALLLLPIASLGLSGVHSGAKPQVAGSSSQTSLPE